MRSPTKILAELRKTKSMPKQLELIRELEIALAKRDERDLGLLLRPLAPRIRDRLLAGASPSEFEGDISTKLLRFSSFTLPSRVRQIRSLLVSAITGALNRQQINASFGVPTDRDANFLPPPGSEPDDVADDASLDDILEVIEPLVAVEGAKAFNRRVNPESLTIEQLDSLEPIPAGSLPLTAVSPIVGIVRRWIRNISRVSLPNTLETINEWYRNWILKPLGLVTTGDVEPTIPRSTSVNNRQSTAIESERDKEAIGEILGPSDIGYEVRSSFAPTTRPEHAARDKMRFYRDDRPGSYRPWSDRLIPPYYYENDQGTAEGEVVNLSGNCLCYSVPILETPEGSEYQANRGIVKIQKQWVDMRDPSRFEAWFDGQSPAVKQKFVGIARYNAVDDFQSEAPRWADFHAPDGRLLSASEIEAETQEERTTRAQTYRAVSEAISRAARQAWLNGQFALTAEEREQYRRSLTSLIRQFSAAS